MTNQIVKHVMNGKELETLRRVLHADIRVYDITFQDEPIPEKLQDQLEQRAFFIDWQEAVNYKIAKQNLALRGSYE